MHDILLIEDDPDDVWLTQRVAKEFDLQFAHAPDGDSALDQLNDRLSKAAPLPDLIFLDINMPRKNGHEVLAQLRADPRLAKIRVVMLTTSDAERDVEHAVLGKADGFITKPIRRGHMLDALDLV
ncbi:MAG: response regulator [Thermoplasmatota archaeon]